jgi:cyclophilin family peptidyl-prolyl cis-trans isomerase
VISRIASLYSSRKLLRTRRTGAAAKPAIEFLEQRTLFAAPQVVSVYTDNRGQVDITFNAQIDPATLDSHSVLLLTSGPDGAFQTGDEARVIGHSRLSAGGTRIIFHPNDAVPFLANTTYSVKISGRLVKGIDGSRIDGEFNGSGFTSGNGTAGGDFLIVSRRNKTNLVARFTTAQGYIDTDLFLSQTPKNVGNFVSYANDGSWDHTIVQRNLPGFIWQSGGYVVDSANTVQQVTPKAPVDNEPHITSNTRGTIALARPDDNNAATDDKGTNQFFFNLVDNNSSDPNSLDNQNGGFTAFGQARNARSLAVMDAIAAHPTIDADGSGSIFDNLAVQNSSITAQQAAADPADTVVTIRRVAILNKIGPYIV